MTNYYTNVRKYFYQSIFSLYYKQLATPDFSEFLPKLLAGKGVQVAARGSVWNTSIPALLSPAWVRWPEQRPHLLKHLSPCGWSVYLKCHNFLKLHSSHCSPGWFRRADVLTLTYNESSSSLPPNRAIFMHTDLHHFFSWALMQDWRLRSTFYFCHPME